MKAIDARTRIRLKNILYCTDLSPAAADAFPYATGLARHFGATLYALHVRRTDQITSAPEQWPELWGANAGVMTFSGSGEAVSSLLSLGRAGM